MAQTRKRRSRKRRGTQGGSIDTNRRAARPRSREEAKARARAGRGRKPAPKQDLPPTWRGALMRGLIMGAIFAVILIVPFGRPIAGSIVFGAFMVAISVPSGYYIDMALWRRRERARIRARGQ